MNTVIYILVTMITLAGSCSATTDTNQPSQEKDKTYPVEEYTKANNLERYSTAIFAGGCFWCTEAVFERITGVRDVISGYAGGDEANPGYGEVGAGKTGHAESIYIYYDQGVIGYEELLEVFFVAHDPTTLNYQGPDYGEEYRSAIFYKTEEEKKLIEEAIKKVNESGMYGDPVVTEVSPYDQFWVAEEYHQNYYELHPENSYVQRVSKPKVEKVKKKFPLMIKEKYKK